MSLVGPFAPAGITNRHRDIGHPCYYMCSCYVIIQESFFLFHKLGLSYYRAENVFFQPDLYQYRLFTCQLFIWQVQVGWWITLGYLVEVLLLITDSSSQLTWRMDFVVKCAPSDTDSELVCMYVHHYWYVNSFHGCHSFPLSTWCSIN